MSTFIVSSAILIKYNLKRGPILNMCIFTHMANVRENKVYNHGNFPITFNTEYGWFFTHIAKIVLCKLWKKFKNIVENLVCICHGNFYHWHHKWNKFFSILRWTKLFNIHSKFLIQIKAIAIEIPCLNLHMPWKFWCYFTFMANFLQKRWQF